MKKQELLTSLKNCRYVYIPVFYNKGKNWKYIRVDKELMIEEIEKDRDTNYLVEVSESGLCVWFF